MAKNPMDQPLPPPVNRSAGRGSQDRQGSLPENADVTSPAGQSAVRDFDPKLSRPAGPDVSYQRESTEPRTVDEERMRQLGPAPVGSKDYVAGQPVTEEEYRRTEADAKARFEASPKDPTPRVGLLQQEDENDA